MTKKKQASLYQAVRAIDRKKLNTETIQPVLEKLGVDADAAVAQFGLLAKIAQQTDAQGFEAWRKGGEMPLVALSPREMEQARGGGFMDFVSTVWDTYVQIGEDILNGEPFGSLDDWRDFLTPDGPYDDGSMLDNYDRSEVHSAL